MIHCRTGEDLAQRTAQLWGQAVITERRARDITPPFCHEDAGSGPGAHRANFTGSAQYSHLSLRYSLYISANLHVMMN